MIRVCDREEGEGWRGEEGEGGMEGGEGGIEGGDGGMEGMEGWRGEGGDGGMEGEGKGLMEGEGKGLIEGMWCWALSPCLGCHSSHRSHRISLLSTCLCMPPWSCPRSLLVPCLRHCVVILCCRHMSFLHLVIVHNKQQGTMTNVVIHRFGA